MGRRKSENSDELLSEIVMLRLSKDTLRKLENIRANSDCGTIPEVIRRVLKQDRIVFFHRDAAMDAPMEILIGIQKELRAIGVNINQVTRNFNSMAGERQRWYQIKRAAQYYNQVDAKVNLLLGIISQLAKKWLQK